MPFSSPLLILILVLSSGLLVLSPNHVRAQFENGNERWHFSGSGKAAFADYDNDGWVDVYSGVLLRNDKGKRFLPVEDANIPGGEGIWGDYNNDGNLDLFVFTDQGSLHKNLGDGQFEKVETPPLPTINSRGAVWVDVNRDGWLDLYVGGYEVWEDKVHPDVILLNSGADRFTEHWQQAKGECYSARGVTSADVDEDGWTEVFVSNYRLQPNLLWKFNAAGELIDVAEERNAIGEPGIEINYTGGVKYPMCGHTIGSCFGDLDNDGHIDLFVGNFSHPRPGQHHPQFLRNTGPAGNFHFEEKSAGAGLAWQESFASPALGDYDNDGDLDLYFTTVYPIASHGVKNFPVLYCNDGDWKFTDVTEKENLDQLPASYQAAWADIDNDGDLDLCTAGTIFVNSQPRGNWIRIRLRADHKRLNGAVTGATARIRLQGQTLTRHVESGTGEGNQNQVSLHFGLGLHSDPVDLIITWPGKVQQTVRGLTVNQLHDISYKADP